MEEFKLAEAVWTINDSSRHLIIVELRSSAMSYHSVIIAQPCATVHESGLHAVKPASRV